MRTLQSMRESLAKTNKIELLARCYLLFIAVNGFFNWIRGRKSNKASDDLVQSNPEYNNVFLMKCGWGARGTAVYIGNNMLITAAHCFSSNPRQTSKINENLHKFTFHETNTKLKIINTYHAKRIYIHPAYIGKRDGSDVDLAIVQLKENITHLRGLELNLDDPTNDWTWMDAISVGYGYRMPPRNSLCWTTRPFAQKIAVKVPQVATFDQCSYAVNILGYNIDFVRAEIQKRQYDPFENGMQPGMSGGPLLHSNKIIGINSGDGIGFSLRITNQITSQEKEYSFFKHLSIIMGIVEKTGCIFNLDGRSNYFTPLYSYKSWIRNIVDECHQTDSLKPRNKAKDALKPRNMAKARI